MDRAFVIWFATHDSKEKPRRSTDEPRIAAACEPAEICVNLIGAACTRYPCCESFADRRQSCYAVFKGKRGTMTFLIAPPMTAVGAGGVR
jgi:hypothetical protein